MGTGGNAPLQGVVGVKDARGGVSVEQSRAFRHKSQCGVLPHENLSGGTCVAFTLDGT